MPLWGGGAKNWQIFTARSTWYTVYVFDFWKFRHIVSRLPNIIQFNRRYLQGMLQFSFIALRNRNYKRTVWDCPFETCMKITRIKIFVIDCNKSTVTVCIEGLCYSIKKQLIWTVHMKDKVFRLSSHWLSILSEFQIFSFFYNIIASSLFTFKVNGLRTTRKQVHQKH